jgi:adenine-specific DNA-methyltransferase
MDKLKMQTKILTEENISKLTKLFPELLTEVEKNGKTIKTINYVKLKEIVGDFAEETDEIYELKWVGKKKSRQKIVNPINKTLRPIPEESIDFENTENLYIEGENFEVLKLLQESYLNRIKIIYIDPPYNTGNDFIYKDKYTITKEDYEEEIGSVDEEGNKLFKNTTTSGRFHSDWLSMMYERLIIAKDLLKDDGVIFISIDDNELNNLKIICDEIFGSRNFRNILLVRRYDKNINLQFVKEGLKSFNTGAEYILIYTKNQDSLLNAVYRESSEERKNKGYWKGFWNDADRPTMRYDLFGVEPDEGQWKWKKELAEDAVKNYKEYLEKYQHLTLEEYSQMTKKVKFIRRNFNGKGKNLGVEHWIPPKEGILRNTLWQDIFASKKNENIPTEFDNPKSTELIKELIKIASTENNIIMDFFSGSSTTAEAVLCYNVENNTTHKFIMVQLKEPTKEDSEAYKGGYKNISDIGKERIRRAAKKINSDYDEIKKRYKIDQKNESNILDLGFRVFKLDTSNMKDVYYNPSEIDQRTLKNFKDNIKEDRSEKDLLFQVLLDLAIPISSKINEEKINNKTIYIVENDFLIACFDEELDLDTIKKIAEYKPLRIVFKDSSFKDDATKVNCEEYLKNKLPNTITKVV